ncbi:2902_t:CDS:1, partial [Acaulospora colombiana]
ILKRKSSSDSSEKTTKNVTIDPENQTESNSDSLENKNEESFEQLGTHTIIVPAISTSVK